MSEPCKLCGVDIKKSPYPPYCRECAKRYRDTIDRQCELNWRASRKELEREDGYIDYERLIYEFRGPTAFKETD
jgi:hypothetical protein